MVKPTKRNQRLVKKITEAFEIFEVNGTKTVDIREVGTIIRSLGLFPSEADLLHVVSEMEDIAEMSTGTVTLDKFLPSVYDMLIQKKFQPASEDQLIKSFQALDTTGRGSLTREELEGYLTGCGEPFTTEEMEEMMAAGLDGQTPELDYKNFVKNMVPL